MNNIISYTKDNIINYILRGPLNKSLKTKLKNKTSKILNNYNIPRNLTTLQITNNDNDETKHIVNNIKLVKPDLKLPAVQLAFVSNKFETDILKNSRKGTYIKTTNKKKYFKNIGKPRNKGYFLRKGVGSKLINYVIKEMKEEDIKTILVYPLNRDLEKYYSEFGFKIIPNVIRNINSDNRKYYYENNNQGRIMYLEL